MDKHKLWNMLLVSVVISLLGAIGFGLLAAADQPAGLPIPRVLIRAVMAGWEAIVAVMVVCVAIGAVIVATVALSGSQRPPSDGDSAASVRGGGK
ncbi:hypothetical protein EJ357_30135 [Streptomyces cyaneochromogenes]|uniref:Uncharacterized protein n=1 Tax=Streptomyces cyaneochromogenes TaxID=2496836 RepID=A0A3S9MDC2_9ACTN|nr:hypothetical protein [Streptomyces cyaneochromogenes]AZQ37184.1 hypothetical protein EJ357_30135 [Streptomyces cyaneochromogenes]